MLKHTIDMLQFRPHLLHTAHVTTLTILPEVHTTHVTAHTGCGNGVAKSGMWGGGERALRSGAPSGVPSALWRTGPCTQNAGVLNDTIS